MFNLEYDTPEELVLLTVPSSSGTPIGPLLWTVFASILEVFILCFAGWVLARRGIIDKKTQKQLNRINVSLFTPSLLFSKVAFSLSPQKLKELYIIPIFFVVVTAVSAAVAWLLGKMLGLKRTQRNFAIAASMFNNSNSLPIALMQSLVITVHGLKWGKNDNKDAMLGRALSYLVLYSTLGMMVRWSYGVHLLSQADDEVLPEIIETAPEPESDTDINDRARRLRRSSVTFNLPDEDEEARPQLSSSGSTASVMDLTDQEPPYTVLQPVKPAKKNPVYFWSFPNTPTRSRVDLASHRGSPDLTDTDNEENGDEWGGLANGHQQITPPTSSRLHSIIRRTKNKIKKTWKKIHEFMTVPMWAAIASLIVACVRPMQHALENHMQPVKGSLVAAGNCSIPVTLIVLGAYFYVPKEDGAEQKSKTLPQTNGHSSSLSPARRDRESRVSESSVATLRESLKDAFRLRAFKKPSTTSNKTDGRKGETKTVFVAIMARMILTPALIMPAMAAFARFDLHRVMDDPVFVVSMVLLVSSPPALTLAQITQAASGDAFERLISKTIFWSYCVFTPPLTILYVVLGLLLSKL